MKLGKEQFLPLNERHWETNPAIFWAFSHWEFRTSHWELPWEKSGCFEGF